MENLHLLHDTYCKDLQQYSDLYLSVTINGKSDLKLQIYSQVKTFFICLHDVKNSEIATVKALNCNTDGNLASE